jgi:periplasmic protein TonB
MILLALQSAATPPTAEGSISPMSYPPAAIRAGEEGRVTVKLSVDARGTLTRCVVTTSSGSAALDAGTCSLFERSVTYRPARNARGRAVPGTLTKSITWKLPT